jgi:hypothetical protein
MQQLPTLEGFQQLMDATCLEQVLQCTCSISCVALVAEGESGHEINLSSILNAWVSGRSVLIEIQDHHQFLALIEGERCKVHFLIIFHIKVMDTIICPKTETTNCWAVVHLSMEGKCMAQSGEPGNCKCFVLHPPGSYAWLSSVTNNHDLLHGKIWPVLSWKQAELLNHIHLG